MERSIVFRAKRMDSNDWIYGSLFTDEKGQCYIKEPNGKLYFIEDKDSIGQFTGMLDNEGKQMFEGDILDLYIPRNAVGKSEHRKRKVIWKDYGFEITNKYGDCICDRCTTSTQLIYTIIGNMTDNPELIEDTL